MKLCATLACLSFMLSSPAALRANAAPSLATPPLPAAAPRDTVLLLHGLGRTQLSLLPLAAALKREGFQVVNLSYPWRTRTLDDLATSWLPDQIARAIPAAPARLHLVTHSMGGILVRLWLAHHAPPSQLGRVVMLAPPNHGSPLADRLATSRLLRLLVGPNGPRLGTAATALPATLGPWPAPTSELGILAGNHSLLPLPTAVLAPPHDGKVTVASTHLAGESAHRTLPFSHTLLPCRRATHDQVTAFLRTGAFLSP